MRVDCYNACETLVSELEYGDTCYYEGTIYIKIRISNSIGEHLNNLGASYLVALDRGELIAVDNSTSVVLADCKVVANTKEVPF